MKEKTGALSLSLPINIESFVTGFVAAATAPTLRDPETAEEYRIIDNPSPVSVRSVEFLAGILVNLSGSHVTFDTGKTVYNKEWVLH